MKSIPAFDQTDDYIWWQGRCIDQRTYELMTSIDTVDNLVLSTCLSAACLVLEIVHMWSMSLRSKSTERQYHQMQVMKVYCNMSRKVGITKIEAIKFIIKFCSKVTNKIRLFICIIFYNFPLHQYDIVNVILSNLKKKSCRIQI